MLELLTMLAAKSPTLNDSPGGGIPKLTPCMVAGSLAGLPRSAYIFIRFAFLGDVEFYPELVKWLNRDYALPEYIARVALVEAVSMGVCPYCNGSAINVKRKTPCKKCTDGKYQWPSDRVAQCLKKDMEAGEFRRKYWLRYREAVADLGGFIADSEEHIYLKLMRMSYQPVHQSALIKQMHREITR